MVYTEAVVKSSYTRFLEDLKSETQKPEPVALTLGLMIKSYKPVKAEVGEALEKLRLLRRKSHTNVNGIKGKVFTYLWIGPQKPIDEMLVDKVVKMVNSIVDKKKSKKTIKDKKGDVSVEEVKPTKGKLPKYDGVLFVPAQLDFLGKMDLPESGVRVEFNGIAAYDKVCRLEFDLKENQLWITFVRTITHGPATFDTNIGWIIVTNQSVAIDKPDAGSVKIQAITNRP